MLKCAPVCGVVFLDINGLKKANDSKGHDYGDYIIMTISKLLQTTFGEKVFRIGGDEFVVLCEDIKKATFEEKERFLRAFALRNTEIKFSLGAVWTDQVVAVERLINSADRAMYEEKRSYYKKSLHCDSEL